MNDAVRYAQLEQGARYLASLAPSWGERSRHLGWANVYCRLRLDALESAAPALTR